MTGAEVRKMTDEEIRQLVRNGADEAKRAGYNIDLTFIMSPDIDSKLAEVLGLVRDKASRLKPFGVIFGGGIRLNADFTPFFEQVVNICREATPESRMGFQSKPDDMRDVCERLFR